MKKLVYIYFGFLAAHCTVFVHRSVAGSAPAFEGRISAISARGGPPVPLLYTVGTNYLRVEMTDTNWPNAIDILDRNSGQMTLVFPHNGTFVRLKAAANNSSASPPGFPQMPSGLPPGIGPQARSNPPGASAMPMRPQMPVPPQRLPPGVGPTNLPECPRCRRCPPHREACHPASARKPRRREQPARPPRQTCLVCPEIPEWAPCRQCR